MRSRVGTIGTDPEITLSLGVSLRLLLSWSCRDLGDRVVSLGEAEANTSSSGWELMRFSVDFKSFKADKVVLCMLDAASFCKYRESQFNGSSII